MAKPIKPKGYWQIKENVDAAAKQCKSRSEFQKKFHQAYNYALKNGWIEDYTWFN